jgi:kumamolisin
MASKKSARHFATQSRTKLAGTEKAPFSKRGGEKPAPLDVRFTVSVIVRRKTALEAAHTPAQSMQLWRQRIERVAL